MSLVIVDGPVCRSRVTSPNCRYEKEALFRQTAMRLKFKRQGAVLVMQRLVRRFLGRVRRKRELEIRKFRAQRKLREFYKIVHARKQRRLGIAAATKLQVSSRQGHQWCLTARGTRDACFFVKCCVFSFIVAMMPARRLSGVVSLHATKFVWYGDKSSLTTRSTT